MKQIFVITWVFLLVSCSANTSNKKESINQIASKRDYKLIIDDIITRYSQGKMVSLEELQNAVPTTQDEFLTYYSFTYTDKGEAINQAFSKVDSEIGKYSENNQGSFLRLFLELSPFVDGEYAESYFDHAGFIIEKNKDVFCRLYPELNEKSRTMLEEYHSKYCK